MSHRKVSDLVSGALFAALGVFVYAQGAAMPAVKRGLGPGGYPRFIAVGLVILGCALAAQYFLKPRPERQSAPDAEAARRARSALVRALLFALLCFAYSQAISPLGFIPASALFLLAAIYFCGYRNHAAAVLVGVLLPVAAYLLFRHLFQVLIPTGTIFR